MGAAPAFAWLDAYQTKRTAFFVSVQSVDPSASADRKTLLGEVHFEAENRPTTDLKWTRNGLTSSLPPLVIALAGHF